MRDRRSPGLRGIFLERDTFLAAASVVAISALAWLYLVHLAGQMELMEGLAGRMMGMPASDGISSLLDRALSPTAAERAEASINFILVALMWAVMMIGMMLPSAAPTILLFLALERTRPATARRGRSSCFVAGYLAAWSLFSVAAATAQTFASRTGLLSMEMATIGSFLSGALFLVAGAYELTPLKSRCLSHCQSPMSWIPSHMRPGPAGAFRMGLEHGAFCVGCCWALMLLLFVGGVMNLVWVAAIAVLVFVQKLLPRGPLISRLTGFILLLCGAALLLRAVTYL